MNKVIQAEHLFRSAPSNPMRVALRAVENSGSTIYHDVNFENSFLSLKYATRELREMQKRFNETGDYKTLMMVENLERTIDAMVGV